MHHEVSRAFPSGPATAWPAFRPTRSETPSVQRLRPRRPRRDSPGASAQGKPGLPRPYGDVNDGVVRLWAAEDLAVALRVAAETLSPCLSIAHAGLD